MSLLTIKRKSLKILLIEDSQILTMLLKHQAKILGVNLTCVDNFVDAIIELKNNIFSFIILDNFLEKVIPKSQLELVNVINLK
jgi:hypothetical protein